MATKKPPRLLARLPAPVDRRLRMQAALERRSLTDVMADVLDRGLPSAADLAAQMRDGEVPDDRAS